MAYRCARRAQEIYILYDHTHNTEKYIATRKGPYSKDGKLLRHSWIDTNNVKQIYVSTDKYENGETRYNSFMVESTYLRTEHFDEHGRITEITQSDINHPLYYTRDTFTDGKLNGKIIRTYKTGRFEIIYKNNRIIQWSYFDFEEGKYIAEYPHPLDPWDGYER